MITYTVTATNSGNTYLNNVIVTDPLLTPPAIPVLFWLGETCVLTGTYTITQADLDACVVNNTASVTGLDPKGETVTTDPVSLALVCAKLTLEKLAAPAICNKIGDTVSHTVTATNSGSVTLYGVVVSDPLLTPNSNSCLPGTW